MIENKIYLRIITIFSICIYVIILIWNYIVWLSSTWLYVGLGYDPLEFIFIINCIIFSILPSFWIPITISRPTMVIYWILYLLTYIPMIIGVSLSPRFNFIQILLFQFSCLASFCLTGVSYFFKLLKIKIKPISKNIFWVIFYSILSSMFFYVIFIFKGNFNLVSPFDENLYDVRFNGSDVAAKDAIVGYYVMWLSGALLPFLLALGVVYKKKIYILLSAFGQIILYSTAANKAFILSILFMLSVYYTIKKTKKIGLVLTAFLIFLVSFLTYTQTEFEGDLKLAFFPLSGLMLVRFVSISSINAINYYDFFLHNPFTYYSHINIISKFVHYPYGNLAIGQVIGLIVSNNSDSNWNANFYLTDGYGALGYWGLIVIGIISGFIFYTIDILLKPQNLILSVLLISNASIDLMNVSIFTTLFSGGLLFLTIFLIFFDTQSLNRNENSNDL